VASVGRANGVGLLEYHFTLIRAMLTDNKFLTFVLIAWLLYGLKCEQFMADKLQGKNYAFISMLNTKPASFVIPLMLQVQMMFFLPVLLYAAICIWIGITHHWYANTVTIALFILTVCLILAWRYDRLIRKNGIVRSVSLIKINLPFLKGNYIRFLLQYIGSRRKMLFLAVKTFSCLFVFGMLLHRTMDESDLSMFLLFYSFGLMGHGILIYKIRHMEECNLGFCRGLPVSLSVRMFQYALLYLILLIPEIIIILLMTPVHLNFANALLLIFFGWGMLILLHSLLFIQLFNPFAYLKIVCGVYLMVFMAILTGLIVPFIIVLFLMSVNIFFRHFYKFELAGGGS
jgi:hypothetical protein